jgi:hypothetical protein
MSCFSNGTWRVLILLLSAAAPLVAQQNENWDPRGAEMTRTELDTLLAHLNRASESSAYSSTLRDRSNSEAAVLRERLTSGDFQVGDRILLRVDGEQALSDTFRVANGPGGPTLSLPIVGDLTLHGVLRSELLTFLQGEIGKFVRDPVVHVRSLVQLSVIGGVLRPGFHTVPADSRLSDVLMLAGLAPDGSLKNLRVDRGNEKLWDGELLQTATNQGRTVDQMNLRAGDQIVVAKQTRHDFERTARIIGMLVTIPITIFGLVNILN